MYCTNQQMIKLSVSCISLISNGSVLHSTNLMVSCEEYTSRILLSAQVAFPTSGGGEWLLKFFQ